MRPRVFIFFLALFAATASGHIYTVDSTLNYMVTKSMASRGTLAVPRFMMTVGGRDGRHYSKLGIGQSLAGLPMFWLGALVESAAPDRALFAAYSRQVIIPHGSHAIAAEPQTLIRLSDREGAPLFFVTLTNVFVAAVLCLVFWMLLKRFGLSDVWALVGTSILAFGTPLWVYSRDFFGEPLFALCLLGTFYLVTDRDSAKPRRLMLAGLVSCVGMLTRATFIPLAAIFAVYMLLSSEERAAGARRFLRYIGFCLPGIVIWALLNYVRFGSVLLTGYHTAFDQGFSVPLFKGIAWNLVSPYRSLLLYGPPVLLGLLGLVSFGRRFRAELLLVVSIVAYVFIVYSGWWAWHGGWCWGPRFLVPIIPLLLVPGFVALASGSRPWAALAVGLGFVGFLVQLGAVLINYTAPYDYWIKIGVLDWAEENIQMFSPITTHWRAALATPPVDYDLWLVQAWKVSKPVAVVIAAGLGVVAVAAGRAIWATRIRRSFM
jgi:hypothetical protein